MRARLFWQSWFGLAALIAAWAASPALASSPNGFNYYEVGDTTAPTPDKTSTGLMLVGGNGHPNEAFRWFVTQAGHGHIVVLRASGAEDIGQDIFHDIGGVLSVQTIVFDDLKAANDPAVIAILRHADGVFIAGGDQSNYIRYWKGTPVQQALNDLVASGKPIGGTSAGLAILGGTAYGALDGGSVDSVGALADPTSSEITLERGFLTLPYMTHIVTDTHFTARARIGRLIAFLARARAEGDPQAVGIGVDETSALCVDASGHARLYSANPNGGYAWLVQPIGTAKTLEHGKPLDWPDIRITGIGPDSRLDMTSLRVNGPAFSGTAHVADGRLTDMPSPPGATWSLAIHGGAGVIPRGSLKPEEEAAYRAGLDDALAAGSAVLRSGGSSTDAVQAAIVVLENNPLFNAGRGAVFDAEGVNELDAAIMDGATLRAGAVAGVKRTQNPILAARAVMEHSRHVLLTGDGADRFAAANGVKQVDPAWFRTDKRWQEYLEWKRGNKDAAIEQTHRYGTVGAVARDMRGHLAAATSTGGLTGKMWGRIGDSPLIGAGTYAQDNACAVSATGTGEYFIREAVGRQICDRVAWHNDGIQAAANNTIGEIDEIGGDGGVITMDRHGKVAFAMNTEGMYRGAVSSDTPAYTAIYANEAPGDGR